MRKSIVNFVIFYGVDPKAPLQVLSSWRCYKVKMSPARKVLDTELYNSNCSRSIQTWDLGRHSVFWINVPFILTFSTS